MEVFALQKHLFAMVELKVRIADKMFLFFFTSYRYQYKINKYFGCINDVKTVS